MIDEITSKIGLTAAGVATALIALGMSVPKLLNGYKTDRIDSNLLERLDKMDEKIHTQAVRITRLTVLIIRLEALLIAHKIDIPVELRQELDEISKEQE
jgi:hypothetical protein